MIRVKFNHPSSVTIRENIVSPIFDQRLTKLSIIIEIKF